MTQFKLERTHWPEAIRFEGELSMDDLVRLDLSPFDRALINGSGAAASDYLLVLEMLFRRIEEQQRQGSVSPASQNSNPTPETPK